MTIIITFIITIIMTITITIHIPITTTVAGTFTVTISTCHLPWKLQCITFIMHKTPCSTHYACMHTYTCVLQPIHMHILIHHWITVASTSYEDCYDLLYIYCIRIYIQLMIDMDKMNVIVFARCSGVMYARSSTCCLFWLHLRTCARVVFFMYCDELPLSL